MSSENVLSPLFEESGSESSPSLLPEVEIKPKTRKKTWSDRWGRQGAAGSDTDWCLTRVITVVLLGKSLQRRFRIGLTATPLRPSLFLPITTEALLGSTKRSERSELSLRTPKPWTYMRPSALRASLRCNVRFSSESLRTWFSAAQRSQLHKRTHYSNLKAYAEQQDLWDVHYHYFYLLLQPLKWIRYFGTRLPCSSVPIKTSRTCKATITISAVCFWINPVNKCLSRDKQLRS